MKYRWLTLMLAVGSVAATADERLEYRVIAPDSHAAGPGSAREAYGQARPGALERERMHAVAPVGRHPTLPPPTVVPYSDAPEPREVVIEQGPRAAVPGGEDAVFEQIRRAPPLERCLMVPGAECDLEFE